MIDSLKNLCNNFDILGIKCETEAEGCSFDEIWAIRCATLSCGTDLALKIGGCEALNDIYKAFEIGVNHIIAPMIETDFACFKFIESINKVYGSNPINLTINIETKTGVANLSSIIEIIKKYEPNRLKNITIGRSDLSASYFDKTIKQNSKFIFDVVENIIKIAKQNDITVSMGGGVDVKTIEYIKANDFLLNNLLKIESRKVMFKTNADTKIFDSIFEFEKQCLLQAKQNQTLKTGDISKRIDILQNRYF